jgi:hypothetical protein
MNTEKQLWLCLLTSQEEWESPVTALVRADTSEEAFEKAITDAGFSKQEVEIMISKGAHSYSTTKIDELTIIN